MASHPDILVWSRQDIAMSPLSYPSVPGQLQVGCRHIGQSDRGFDGRASAIVIR